MDHILRNIELTNSTRCKLENLIDQIHNNSIAQGILGNRICCSLQQCGYGGTANAYITRTFDPAGIERFDLRISFYDETCMHVFENTIFVTSNMSYNDIRQRLLEKMIALTPPSSINDNELLSRIIDLFLK